MTRTWFAPRARLSPELRWLVRTWLADKPALRELWAVKEALNRIYRVRGRNRAKNALARLTDAMAFSTLPELRTLRRTLVYWRKEILAYFYCRLTQARPVRLLSARLAQEG